mmetsp:Transcript_25975/g.57217  ORF Transcript_25975/g.57217 Transcript_25975/m.57217 type:complete len:237 (+) Transcript_25975:603-1313(+)
MLGAGEYGMERFVARPSPFSRPLGPGENVTERFVAPMPSFLSRALAPRVRKPGDSPTGVPVVEKNAAGDGSFCGVWGATAAAAASTVEPSRSNEPVLLFPILILPDFGSEAGEDDPAEFFVGLATVSELCPLDCFGLPEVSPRTRAIMLMPGSFGKSFEIVGCFEISFKSDRPVRFELESPRKFDNNPVPARPGLFAMLPTIAFEAPISSSFSKNFFIFEFCDHSPFSPINSNNFS